MKTKTEIIEETFEYYKTHPRAINKNEGCSYLTDTGAMCAVGRCMTDEAVNFQKDNMDEGAGGCGLRLHDFSFSGGIGNYTELDKLLKPEYHGHSVSFWQELQNFHDHNGWKLGEDNTQNSFEALLARWGR